MMNVKIFYNNDVGMELFSNAPDHVCFTLWYKQENVGSYAVWGCTSSFMYPNGLVVENVNLDQAVELAIKQYLG